MKDSGLQSNIYPLHKVYGPYTRSDGRSHVILYYQGHRQTMSYPKFILQEKLGRMLTEDETVDHIDENIFNDSLDNLQILTRVENARKSAATRLAMIDFNCEYCGKRISKYEPQVRANRKRSKHGPYCNRYCSRQHQIIGYAETRSAGTGIQDGPKNHCSNEHEGSNPSSETN